MECENIVIKSKKIKIYPSYDQKLILRKWFGASRLVYNKTIEHLNNKEIKADWIKIKLWLLKTLPEWCKEVPFQVKGIAVKDACVAVKNAKIKYKKTGIFNKVKFKSIKNISESIFITKSAIKKDGIYSTILGKLNYSEPLPENILDSRLVFQNGQYFICINYSTNKSNVNNCNNRVVSLDPGVRTFQTFFSENSCGKIGLYSINKIQRLCYYLDDLVGRTSKTKGKKKRRMKKAIANMRVKIKNLISELHNKTIKFLFDNFDIVLLPTFETSNMVKRGKRKIRSKTARQMLTLSHYRFKERIINKAKELNKIVIIVNEVYTSKTVSWSGEIKNIGSSKIIKSQGVIMDRDYNGARGIMLRALVDTPTKEILLQNVCIS
jgi:putative transposase